MKFGLGWNSTSTTACSVINDKDFECFSILFVGWKSAVYNSQWHRRLLCWLFWREIRHKMHQMQESHEQWGRHLQKWGNYFFWKVQCRDLPVPGDYYIIVAPHPLARKRVYVWSKPEYRKCKNNSTENINQRVGTRASK